MLIPETSHSEISPNLLGALHHSSTASCSSSFVSGVNTWAEGGGGEGEAHFAAHSLYSFRASSKSTRQLS